MAITSLKEECWINSFDVFNFQNFLILQDLTTIKFYVDMICNWKDTTTLILTNHIDKQIIVDSTVCYQESWKKWFALPLSQIYHMLQIMQIFLREKWKG